MVFFYWGLPMKHNNFLALFSHMDSVNMKKMNKNFQSVFQYIYAEGDSVLCIATDAELSPIGRISVSWKKAA